MSEIDVKNIKNIGKNTCSEILSAREDAISNTAKISEDLNLLQSKDRKHRLGLPK